MIRFVPLAVVLLLCAVIPVAAQEATLTLDGAVQEALAHNASLRAAQAVSAEADAQVTLDRAGWFPRFTVTESWQRGNEPVFVFSSLLSSREFAAANFAVESLNHPAPISFFQTAVGVEQVMFDGGRQRATVRAATLRHQIADFAVDEAAARLALTVTQTFGRLITAEANARAAAAALDAAREDQHRTEQRRDAGMATDADVLSFVTHAADLQQRVIQAQSDASVARAELNQLMGAPIDRDYRSIEPPMVDVSDAAERPVEDLIAEAERNRPELKRLVAADRLADAGRATARSSLLPQIAAHGLVDISGTQFDDRASAWLVGAAARWTFSLGGAELAQIKAANEAARRVHAEADDVRGRVHVDVITAVSRLEAARAREIVGRAAVDQARESQRIIRDRFEAGMASVGDALRASSAVLDADAQHVSAVVDAMVSRAVLRQAIGRAP
jgi:outer membrane protein TolC